MRARVLLWFSLGLNLLLAGMVVLLSRESERASSAQSLHVRAAASAPTIKTNVVLRRQSFSWSEVESPDYPTYIANLRRIGCPEKTIRDIVVADVNELFAERVARELILPEQQWWLPEPELDAFEAAMNQVRALETEKNQMLTQLLGSGWETSRNNPQGGLVRFDGPVLNEPQQSPGWVGAVRWASPQRPAPRGQNGGVSNRAKPAAGDQRCSGPLGTVAVAGGNARPARHDSHAGAIGGISPSLLGNG